MNPHGGLLGPDCGACINISWGGSGELCVGGCACICSLASEQSMRAKTCLRGRACRWESCASAAECSAAFCARTERKPGRAAERGSARPSFLGCSCMFTCTFWVFQRRRCRTPAEANVQLSSSVFRFCAHAEAAAPGELPSSDVERFGGFRADLRC